MAAAPAPATRLSSSTETSPVTPQVALTTEVVATDHCGTVTVSQTPLARTTVALEPRTVTLTASDASGNPTSCDVTITVADRTSPVPNVPTLPTISGKCFVQVTTIPTATDNCAGAITGTTSDPLTYSVADTYTVIWHYADGSGNEATQPQTVVVSPGLATSLMYSGAKSDSAGATTSLKATLEAGGSPLVGKIVTFTIGTQTASAWTNKRGVASTSLVLNQPAGEYTM